jgi:hypothetical protein
MEELVELTFGLIAPVPGIMERGDLCLALVALRGFEKQVIVALRIEGSIEVDEIDGSIFQRVPHHVQVVTVKELSWRNGF